MRPGRSQSVSQTWQEHGINGRREESQISEPGDATIREVRRAVMQTRVLASSKPPDRAPD